MTIYHHIPIYLGYIGDFWWFFYFSIYHPKISCWYIIYWWYIINLSQYFRLWSGFPTKFFSSRHHPLFLMLSYLLGYLFLFWSIYMLFIFTSLYRKHVIIYRYILDSLCFFLACLTLPILWQKRKWRILIVYQGITKYIRGEY